MCVNVPEFVGTVVFCCRLKSDVVTLLAVSTYYFAILGDPELFKRLMKFMTGSPSVPPLGLPRNIRVLFVHACPADCHCKPYVSTCDLCINVAVHYDTKAKMLAALTDSIGMSRGFDDV